MFPRRFYAGRMFAPRFYPQSSGTLTDSGEGARYTLYGRDTSRADLSSADTSRVTLHGRDTSRATLTSRDSSRAEL